MSIKQISVFLENKPGKLKEMTGVLAAHNVDMRALSLAETKDFGIARLVVNDVLEAVNILKEEDFTKWKGRLVRDLKTVVLMYNTFIDQKIGYQISIRLLL